MAKRVLKLTYEQAKQIRALHPQHSVRVLAGMYGVSKSLVHNIIINKIYKAEKYEAKDHE